MPQAIHESISFNSRNREVAIHYENVPQAQFMPQAIHESISFNSRNREVAIHYENVPQAQFVRLQFIAGLPVRTTPHI